MCYAAGVAIKFVYKPCVRLHVDALRLSLILVFAEIGIVSATGLHIAPLERLVLMLIHF